MKVGGLLVLIAGVALGFVAAAVAFVAAVGSREMYPETAIALAGLAMCLAISSVGLFIGGAVLMTGPRSDGIATRGYARTSMLPPPTGQRGPSAPTAPTAPTGPAQA